MFLSAFVLYSLLLLSRTLIELSPLTGQQDGRAKMQFSSNSQGMMLSFSRTIRST